MATTSNWDIVEFSENPGPRCPCVLLLDISGSMEGAPIAALNQGLRAFKNELVRDSEASRTVEVAVITFEDKVNVEQDFVTADQFEPVDFTAGGHTTMGDAILQALDLIETRKQQYRANGIDYYRPWIFMITDGEPDYKFETVENVQRAAERIHQEEGRGKVVFHAVAVEGANVKRLAELAVRPPIPLVGLDFEQMFLWLSKSIAEVVKGQGEQQIALPPAGTQTP